MYKRFKFICNKPAILFKQFCINWLNKLAKNKSHFVYGIYLLILTILFISCVIQLNGKFWLIWYYISLYMTYTWDNLYLTDEEEQSFVESIKSFSVKNTDSTK